jgi:hypothetical protein
MAHCAPRSEFPDGHQNVWMIVAPGAMHVWLLTRHPMMSPLVREPRALDSGTCATPDPAISTALPEMPVGLIGLSKATTSRPQSRPKATD